MQTRIMNDMQIPDGELKMSEMQIEMMNDVQISKAELMKKQGNLIGIALLVALVCAAIVRFGNVV